MNKENEFQAKVVLIGDVATGKSSIAIRFCNNKFNEGYYSTAGSSYFEKTIGYNNISLKLGIWDTAGQEKFRSLSTLFFNDAKIGIFVYDISRKTSFENLCNFWVENLKENLNQDLVIGVAANKSDLNSEREVPEEDGKKFADNIGGFFFSTSCKDNSGINELFNVLGIKFLEKQNVIEKDINNINIESIKEGENKKKEEEEERELNHGSKTITLSSHKVQKKKNCYF